MNVPEIPLRINTHTKQVLQLYKQALRNIVASYMFHHTGMARVRLESVLLRERFERTRKCSGPEASQMLIDGQNELKKNLCYSPLKFAGSYGGLTHNRDSVYSDFVLDYWHPLEKAQYPEYFAKRESYKQKFINMWNKKYLSNSGKTIEKAKCYRK